MEIMFASNNPHKLSELRGILGEVGVILTCLSSLESPPEEPVEDGATFEENARIKALAYAAATNQRCLAEDSGLEVDALDGAPGVYSARYAGTDGSRDVRDQANNAKLLKAIRGVPVDQRQARFWCAMCVADPDGNIIAETRASYEGQITDRPRGTNGFGYDPLLYLPDVGMTSAELSTTEKNKRSHRGQAARQLASLLRSG